MSFASEWLRKSFCFPCMKRTAMLSEALEESKKALAIRQAAVDQLKESINERSIESAVS